MMKEVAAGVFVHVSEFMLSNAAVVHGVDGVLVVDPGIRDDEIVSIAADLNGTPVVAGFSTHPHWDHLLWHDSLGQAPRYGTARAAAAIQARLADPDWKAFVTGMIHPDVVGQLTLDDSFGRITGLPAETTEVPWRGPVIRIIEHQAHAAGHAALLVEGVSVLLAGDMLSDVLIPMLNFMSPDPLGDYLAGLDVIEAAAGTANWIVPGHGTVGGVGEAQARIDQDRAYLQALGDGRESNDPRIGDSARPGWEWVRDVHAGYQQRLAQ